VWQCVLKSVLGIAGLYLCSLFVRDLWVMRLIAVGLG
jgi:hypothetical protein